MLMNFKLLMFSSLVAMGAIFSLSSNNWVSMWIGMEISMMSFLPMMSSKLKLSSESCIKYYIIQSLSSSIMMMGIIMMSLNIKSELILMSSLLMKLGMMPFHNWVLSIIEGMTHTNIIIMFTILSLAPLNMISFLEMNLQFLVVLSLVVSSMSALNQNSLKKIMTYSSIYNLSIILSSISSWSIWMTFMTIYSISTVVIMMMFKKMNFNFINQIMTLNNSMAMKIEMLMAILSMAGMPPASMFMMKMMIMESLIMSKEYLIISTIILTSTITMFFYMRISIMVMTIYHTTSKWMPVSKNQSMATMILLLSLIFPTLLYLKSFM
uniref:NADH-ubiquinone oxidoreductase chain 2 n=1 Tax=Stictocephala bisonia TaxID=1585304 RepID=A0A894JLW5_9HEMI|nr:NADH dehydrogenase subunit 2 [Stictocephala bisonia]QRV59917.1 NADH dehydrogenase subunit 2 [Stictocephala bisonia]